MLLHHPQTLVAKGLLVWIRLKCPLRPLRCPLRPLKCPLRPLRCPLRPLRCPLRPLNCPLRPLRCPLRPLRCPLRPLRCPSPATVRRLVWVLLQSERSWKRLSLVACCSPPCFCCSSKRSPEPLWLQVMPVNPANLRYWSLFDCRVTKFRSTTVRSMMPPQLLKLFVIWIQEVSTLFLFGRILRLAKDRKQALALALKL